MSLFDAELVDAGLALEEAFAEAFALAPFAPAADPNAPMVADGSRPAGTLWATYFDPVEKKPPIHNWDEREPRRPGIETAEPRIEITPAALAAWPAANSGAALTIQKGDQVTRAADGAVFRVRSVYVSETGFVTLGLNRLG